MGLEQWTTLLIALPAFYVAKRAQGVAAHTLKWYGKRLNHFTHWLDAKGVTHLEQITPTHLREYLIELESKGHNPGGVHSYFRAVRSFLIWYERETETGWKNPIRKVTAPKVPENILEPAPLESIQRLLDNTKKNYLYNRDRAIILTLWDTGLRASEIISLDVSDIDLLTGAIILRRGKGGKGRVVAVAKKTRKAIRLYLRDRTDKADPLFTSRFGERLTYSGIRLIISHRAKEAGIKAPPLHSFRRRFTLDMLRRHVDPVTLQRLLGHSDLSMLKRYAKLTQNDLLAEHARGSPVDNAD